MADTKDPQDTADQTTGAAEDAETVNEVAETGSEQDAPSDTRESAEQLTDHAADAEERSDTTTDDHADEDNGDGNEGTFGDDSTIDDEPAVDAIDVGNGTVIGNGEVQSFIPGNGNPAVGGDGATGRSNDGVTYQSPDGATGADTHDGGLGIGTTPVAPTPQTADALVASIAHPAKVEEHVVRVIDEFRTGKDKPVTASMNLFDDLGIARADLPALAAKLNEHFGTTLLVTEAQNFLLVRDVQNMMKRKLAVANVASA